MQFCACESKFADRAKGKVITIRAGSQMFKQTVSGSAGTDYVTEVNLDPMGY